MKNYLVITLVLVFSYLTAAGVDAGTTDGFDSWLRAEVEKTAEAPGFRALVFYVVIPGAEYSAASGPAYPDGDGPLTANTPVRIASVTKTFVAAAALRLWEQDRLDLDAPIETMLPGDWVGKLRADGYATDRIRVRELLSHTGGLFDHSDSPKYVEAIMAGPDKRWTAGEQVFKAVEWGDPLSEPGEEFHYSDTGYVMLGTILETIAGAGLSSVVRGQLGFERNGLRDTWWEITESKPDGTPRRAHQYLDSLDVTFFDGSIDLYGGGGLMSTARDVAWFFRLLFHGEIFANEKTFDLMLSRRGLPADTPYSLGLFHGEAAGHKIYWHSGYWGVYAAHVPSLDCSLSFVVTRRQDYRQALTLVERIIGELPR